MALKEGDWVYVSNESREDAIYGRHIRMYLRACAEGSPAHMCVFSGYESFYMEHRPYDTYIWKYVVPVEEEKMDERQEALKRIEAAEREITAAKKILEKPDPRIGKICICADRLEDLADSKFAYFVSEIRVGEIYPIRTAHRGDRKSVV